MPEANNYAFGIRELTELLVKASGVQEGRWVLAVNFGFAPSSFLTAPDVANPGVSVLVQGVGIQREIPEGSAPKGAVVDAAALYAESRGPTVPKAAKPKASST
jgi:hypothetical protein